MDRRISRRSALKILGAAGASLTFPLPSFARRQPPGGPTRLGVIADLHGGLAEDATKRLDAFLADMKAESCDALVQLGDFAYPDAKHQHFADRFNAAHETTLHVIGNHEFDFGLTREDCYTAWGITSSFYRRDIGGLRILVLDGNDAGSPTHRGGYPSYIGPRQLEWLEGELSGSEKPILILSHQPLAGSAAVDNAATIQALLARFRSKIVLCMNGHSHLDAYEQVDGVPYVHFNSASYYWVGGEARMAYYTAPLYSTVTVDPASATVHITGRAADWRGKSPEELDYFARQGRPARQSVTPRIRPHHISRSELTVMTWNIWGRLNEDPRYSIDGKTARERMIEIVRDSRADVVAMIETYGSAADIAESLGFEYHTESASANLCIFSRYPLSEIELLEGLNPFSFIAATVTLPGGQRVRVYDIWLTSGGRHIVDIKNPQVSDEEFTRGDDNRYEHVQQLLEHPRFQKDYANAEAVPLIVAGDFNCVSHLDHTEETKRAGLNHARDLPIKTSKAMTDLGFTDTYRAAHPEIRPDTYGHTWTTVGMGFVYEADKGFVPVDENPEPKYRDPYTRIDYIYAYGRKLGIAESDVLTHHPSNPKRSFPEFPSDHAAVVTRFRVQA